MTVVPGVTVHIPRNTWCGLRNTGTGALQITWMAAPTGLEQFFRELAKLGAPADTVTLQSLGQRYGIEFRDEGEVARASAGPAHEHRPGRRRRRGGRGRGQGGGQHASGAPGVAQPEAAPRPAQEQVPPSVAPSGALPSGPQERQVQAPRQAGQGRRRRHRRRGTSQTPTASGSPAPRPQRPAQPPQPAADRQRSRGRPQHRRGRVKEVYMGGRWVPVVGEGPVIAPGRERSTRRGGSAGHHDDDSPSGLTVPL